MNWFLFSYRDLIRNLVARDFKTRYKRSYLGILWSLFNPLLIIIVYTLAFDYIMKIRVKDFPVFFMCGYLPWSYFSSSLLISLPSFSESGYLIKAVYFPREILPLSIVLSSLIHFLITFLFVFPILIIYGYFPRLALIILPLLIALHTLFVYGISLMMSSLHVFFRDIKYILDVILIAWFWLTPIAYPISLIPEQYLLLYKLNPMTLMIMSYREILLSGSFLGLKYWGALIFFTSLSLFLGYFLFFIIKKRLAEEL